MSAFSEIADQLGFMPKGNPEPVGGGCIHNAYRWGSCFIKTNRLSEEPNLRAEATGLEAIRRTGEIRVPETIAHGRAENVAFLALEHLDLTPRGDEARLGEQLAALHQHTAGSFGFSTDNFIGATPQCNTPTKDWPGFFRDQRLSPMIQLLAAKGIIFNESERFLAKLPGLLPERPPAALLHGDLWGGNKAFLHDGTPVLFDPACHYGHAACDLAMTTLFGGFSPRFYEAYHSSEHHDDPALHEIYTLYHVLNHALLFGGSYVDQSRQLLRRLA